MWRLKGNEREIQVFEGKNKKWIQRGYGVMHLRIQQLIQTLHIAATWQTVKLVSHVCFMPLTDMPIFSSKHI